MNLIDVIVPDPYSLYIRTDKGPVHILKYTNINISFSTHVSFVEGKRVESQRPHITYDVLFDRENGIKLSSLFDLNFARLHQSKQTIISIKGYKFKANIKATPTSTPYENRHNYSDEPEVSKGYISEAKMEISLEGMEIGDLFDEIDESYNKYQKEQGAFISRFELMDMEDEI